MMRCTLALATAIVTLLLHGPAFAARAIQGAAGEIPVADGAALGLIGFRIWSALPGGETNINDNVSSCRNVRCIRGFVTNATLAGPGAPGGGGYVGNMEATQVYNGDVFDQHFYELLDASMNDDAGNHIGYFGVAGVTANSSGIGSILADACPGTNATNCFERLDSGSARPRLTGTYVGYGGPPNTIRAIGGLNPIPNVRIDSIVMDLASLSWNDPPTYQEAMRPSNTAPAPPSPVLGVRLWKNERVGDCNSPTAIDPGWASVGIFSLGQTTAQVTLDSLATCTFFALTVRFIGPGGLPNEVETFRVGVNSHPAIANCNEGQPCTDDFNVCTDDVCSGGACAHLLIPGPCNDGDACTQTDACQSGVCTGSNPVVCTASDQCHDVGTCNASTGICSNPLKANGTPCSDGNACTVGDGCSGGQCLGGGAPNCDDINVCTDDSCVTPTGCLNANNAAPCDDSNPCTINDVCAGGGCGGTTIVAPPNVANDRLPTKSTLAWDAVPGAVPGTVYDVVRGRANELPPGIGPSETCRTPPGGVAQTSISVPEFPPIGKALWYLVRARNTCGPGGYGSWSNGVPRFTDACP